MKVKLTAYVLTGLLALPFAVPMAELSAMDMGRPGMDMAMDSDTVMLPSVSTGGVDAMAHLKDIHTAMSKMGMPQTHHFMVMFTDSDHHSIASGVAAVKVTQPDGRITAPAQLMFMENGFGADLTLTEKGSYVFEVGTKLADGKKRTFTFPYTIK